MSEKPTKEEGAGPEAGKALSPSLDRLRGLFAAGIISERTFHDETAKLHKPAPEVAPLVYHKTPATVAPPLERCVRAIPTADPMRFNLSHDRQPVGNLTALEAIRSRKPPAPWAPSIDDWDLLPDV